MESNNYSEIKKFFWRFVRAGLAGGFGTVTTLALVLQVDLSNYKVYVVAVGSAFIAGFINASAKFLREYFSNGDPESKINKIPV